MAAGDNSDIYNRLISNLPPWWGNTHPNLDALFQSLVYLYFFHYKEQYLYVLLQARLQTATGENLDLISLDYLGNTLPRYVNENDDSYRIRIKSTLLEEKATRFGMSNAIRILTGYVPDIFEPWDSFDTGYYNVPQTLAYNTFGAYGGGGSS